jgi:hypothetical protein
LQQYCKLGYLCNLMKLKLNWDGLGMATSVICAIHCGLLPIVLPTLPLFGINIVHNAFFEWAMIGLAFGVGAYSLYHGYKRHHHSLYPVLFFGIGFFFLVAKQFYKPGELLLLSFAVLFIIYGHWRNYKLCRKNRCHSAHHSH